MEWVEPSLSLKQHLKQEGGGRLLREGRWAIGKHRVSPRDAPSSVSTAASSPASICVRASVLKVQGFLDSHLPSCNPRPQ